MGLPMADLAAGLFAALGVLAALIERQRSGRGQLVDVAMLDAMVGLLTQYAGRYFMTGEDAEPVGSGHPAVSPYGAYKTADGYIVIANLGEAFWPKIARAIGRPELAVDERFRTNAARLANRDELEALITSETRKRTTSEWEAIFEREDVPHGPVNSVSQVLQHTSVLARGMVTEYDHPKLGRWPTTGRAIRFSAHEGEPFEAPPLLGEDTRAVLRDVLGYAPERIGALARSGVVGLGSR